MFVTYFPVINLEKNKQYFKNLSIVYEITSVTSWKILQSSRTLKSSRGTNCVAAFLEFVVWKCLGIYYLFSK